MKSRDLVYIVMKYVHGESLAERMRREVRLAPDEVRRLLRDLALALDSAHRDGVIHRDLKPENILIERGSGRAMLTDFGVALVRSLDPVRGEVSRVFGTPHYMSPEQAVGELVIDGRSDLYSVGVLGYYMLSGRLPFDAPTFEALAAKHIGESPAPLRSLVPKAPASLAETIERALAKERDLRWKDGRAMADALACTERVAPVVPRRERSRRDAVSKSSCRRACAARNGAENRDTVDADLIRAAC